VSCTGHCYFEQKKEAVDMHRWRNKQATSWSGLPAHLGERTAALSRLRLRTRIVPVGCRSFPCCPPGFGCSTFWYQHTVYTSCL